jgi:hypothetical protein
MKKLSFKVLFISLLTIFSLNAQVDVHEYENSVPLKGDFYFKNNSDKTLYLVLVSKVEKNLAQKMVIAELSTVRKKLLPRENTTIKSSVVYDEIIK